jgi:hypothetical protein
MNDDTLTYVQFLASSERVVLRQTFVAGETWEDAMGRVESWADENLVGQFVVQLTREAELTPDSCWLVLRCANKTDAEHAARFFAVTP